MCSSDLPSSMPYVYFLADVKGKEDALKSLLDRLTQIAEEQGMPKETKDDVTSFKIGGGAPRQELAFSIKGGIFAIGNDAESLKATVGALESGRKEKSLADNARFQDFRQSAGGSGDFELFVDVARAVELAGDIAGAEAGAAVATLGLNAFQSAGVSGTVGQGDFDHNTQFILNVKGETPLLKLFNMPAKPTKPEAWVPDNVVSYFSFNWDLEQFYNTLSSVLNAVMPGAMDQADAMLAGPDPDNPLLNIKKDLIGPLGNRISIMSDMIEEKKGQPTGRVLIAWQQIGRAHV